MNNLLLEPPCDDADLFMDKLIIDRDSGAPITPMAPGMKATSDGVQFTTLVPKPGFCVKMKSSSNHGNEKVFLNVCVSDNVPEPQDLTEADLIKLLESDDPTGFRIPMSIGEPHAEMDKGGAGCTAYDVIIHPSFLKKTQDSRIFQAFFIQVTREGIEGKFDVELSQEYVILKNRKSIGKLMEQNVRAKSKPFIVDMDEQIPSEGSRPLITETKTVEIQKGPEPKFSIIQEPATGHPDFLVAEVHLPLVKYAASLTLDVGEDRILLDTRTNVYYLDIYLPYNIVQDDVGSQFDRKTKILTITMPVQPKS